MKKIIVAVLIVVVSSFSLNSLASEKTTGFLRHAPKFSTEAMAGLGETLNNPNISCRKKRKAIKEFWCDTLNACENNTRKRKHLVELREAFAFNVFVHDNRCFYNSEQIKRMLK